MSSSSIPTSINTPIPFSTDQLRKHLNASIDYEKLIKECRLKNRTDTEKDIEEALSPILSFAPQATFDPKILKWPTYILKKMQRVLSEEQTDDSVKLLRVCTTNKSARELLAGMVMKDPVKQSFHEKKAHDFLATHMVLVSALPIRLPNNGPGSKKASAQKGNASQVKTYDFEWEYSCSGETLRAHASHKYTSNGNGNGGGAQDNQFKDLCTFIEFHQANAQFTSPVSYRYYAIADGDYYQSPKKNGNLLKTRIEAECGKLGNDSPVRVLTVNDVALRWALDVGHWADTLGLNLPYYDACVVAEARIVALERGVPIPSPVAAHQTGASQRNVLFPNK